MSIRSAASQAIVDTFTTVSATTRGVTSGANSFANYSEMLEVPCPRYRTRLRLLAIWLLRLSAGPAPTAALRSPQSLTQRHLPLSSQKDVARRP